MTNLTPSKKFRELLPKRFYVPDVDATVKEIKRQIITKQAIQMDYDTWQVRIFEVPATVFIFGKKLVGLRYVQ